MKKILCVDDIKTNLFTLEALFESNYENVYEIITVESGQEALNILLKEDIDLILLDVMMPDLDGFQTATLIQKNRKTKEIPIIFLTAKKDEETITSCYEVGGVDYMSKPFNSRELFVRVKFHLDLVQNKKVLQEEKNLIQNILDTQENLVLVTGGETIIKINRSVREFYGVKSSNELQEKYGNICNSFIKKEGYFSLDDVKEGEFWIETLQKQLENHNILVLIKDEKTDKENSFDIKVKQFGIHYLISLTNITFIDSRNKKYVHQAHYDSLTNIYNRAKLEELLLNQVQQVELFDEKFSLTMIDIDHFKEVNDTYGHLVGDAVLKTLAKLVTSSIRDTDIFARWGGEEFVLVTPHVGSKITSSIVNNLRVKIKEYDFDTVKNITCSFGVTEYIKGEPISSTLKRADDALYEAKESGRDRVCIR